MARLMSRLNRQLALAVLSVSALTACADIAGQQAMEARSTVVGMPKAALLACAGAPERQATADGQEFLTYTNNRIETFSSGLYSGLGTVWGPTGGWYVGNAAGPVYYDARSLNRSCVATFTMKNGKVEKLTYSGDAADPNLQGLCWPIVGACLDAAKPPPGPGPGPSNPAVK